jgi:hypothetical protein
MPSPSEEIFRDILKDLSVHWNFTNCIGSTVGKKSESNARQSLAVNILTTNHTIPFFCRLLGTKFLNL